MNSNDKYHEDINYPISKIEKFNEWMLKSKFNLLCKQRGYD